MLSVFLFLALWAHSSLHERSNFYNKSSLTSQWLQPAYMNEQFPQLIGPNYWQLDFLNIEKIIKNVKTQADGRLLIDHDTAELLQLVNLQLTKHMPDKEWQRLNFLLEQSLGSRVGENFSELVNAYYFYRKKQIISLNEINLATQDEKITLLKTTAHRAYLSQKQYFGAEAAKKLFKMKNNTTNYLNARRIVNMENGLSKEQKKEQLAILARIYKDSLPNR
jgi:hypothetical protein